MAVASKPLGACDTVWVNLLHWRRAQPAANAIAICPEERGGKRNGNKLSRWLTSPPEAASLKMPPAALPGAKLLKSLINRF